jgi:hypothetical protein
MNSIPIFYIKSSGDRRRSSDLARPRCTPSFSGRDGPTSRKVYAFWASAIYLIITRDYSSLIEQPRILCLKENLVDILFKRKLLMD